jgi:hypothetical protein
MKIGVGCEQRKLINEKECCIFQTGVDTEKDLVTVPVPYGGFLLFSNMIPHRR